MSSSKKLISHTSIYMLGDILRRAVSLIMLPIYTRYLTTSDYGVVELLSIVIDFTSIVFGARVGQAVFRFYCTSNTKQEKNAVISSALFLSTITNAFGVAIVYMLADRISILVFSSPEYSTLIQLFAFTMLLEPFMQIPLTHMRAEQRPWLFLMFSVTKLTIQLSLNIYLIVVLDMHVEGVIYSAVISGGIMSVLLTAYSLSRVGFNIDRHRCKTLFNFSLPLKIATFGSFYLAFGDRYILNLYTDLSQVGIYALGYKFGFIFLVLAWDPFQNLWDSEKYNVYKKDNAKEIFQQVFLYINLLLVFIGLAISSLTEDLLRIMSDPAFLDAYKVAPIIILAYLIQAWTKYCSFGILISNKTMQLAYAEAIGVVTITIAYFALIPTYGIYGAAWATVFGFTARFIWTYKKGDEYYPMNLPWSQVLAALAAALATLYIAYLLPDNLILSICSKLILLVIFAVAVITSPIISPSDRATLVKTLRHHLPSRQ